MVGREESLDIQESWLRGKSISEIARMTGRDRRTIRRLVREGPSVPRACRQVASKLDGYRDYLLERMLGPDKVTNAAVLFDVSAGTAADAASSGSRPPVAAADRRQGHGAV